jgi:hypothetical protein
MLMKTRNLLYLFVMLSLISCREFIEPSLEKKQIKAIAPADGIETSSYQLTFWWETHQDAFQYRLQVASPSFSAIEKLVLDTVVKNDKFTYTLEPGDYEWRIRAENGSSQTPYVTRNFIIHPSALTNQLVQLQSPANNIFTANAEIQYEWLKLFGATKYRLQIDNQNFADENNLVLNVLTENLSYLNTLQTEGKYQFRVRGENATENSKWSTVRNLTFDRTPPAKVVLTSPANKQTLPKPFNLMWNAISDADKYELLVYRSDSVTLYHTNYPQLLSTNTQQFNLGNANETLVWRVRAIDKAGNKGEFSSFYTFTIQ